jgi:DNA-binding IclR family transcriptional regulator
MAASSEPGRTAASRLFAVLNAFNATYPTMNLTELSIAADLPIATTFRIARELLTAGALERTEDGRYQVGLRLWEIGSLAPRQRDLRRVARPLMENLCEITGETVQLAVAGQQRALVIERISGARPVGDLSEVAGELPLHATAVGKVLLAFVDWSDASRLSLEPPLRRYTAKTTVEMTEITRELQSVRTHFVATAREEFTPRIWSVGAPVFDSEGHLVASLGILTRFPTALDALDPAVRTAALAISQRMGYHSDSWPRLVAGPTRPLLSVSA